MFTTTIHNSLIVFVFAQQIALEVSEGRLRPKLPEDDGQSGEIRDLISCSWHQDAESRPNFARISLDLRKIIDKLK